MKSITIIAKFTFLEVYRSKIMIGLIFLAAAMLVITSVASAFAYGAPDKVALDFSIGAMSISNLLISIFLGVTLVNKEIESKTLYMILSRPISRFSFLIGKIIGLSSVLVINTVFLMVVGDLCYKYLGGTSNQLIYWVSFFSLMEAVLVMLFGVFFSLIANPTLASIFTIIVFIAGHTLTLTLTNVFAKASTTVMLILRYSLFFIPDLDRINLKDFLIYKQELPLSFLLSNVVYVGLYIAVLIVVSTVIFNRRNLD